MMKQLDILLPYTLIPDALRQGIMPHIEADALAKLLGDSKKTTIIQTPSSITLPEEFWLASEFALPNQQNEDYYSLEIAHALMARLIDEAPQGSWFILQPSHFAVGMNQISLTPYTQLDITDTESQALFDTAQQVANEYGHQMIYGNRHFWFIKAGQWQHLHTTSPLSLQGSGIDVALPTGDHARDWRKLHNDIQMHWYNHPVNQAREDNNLLPVNGLWLWGGSHYSPAEIRHPYDSVITSRNNPHSAVQAIIHAQYERHYAQPAVKRQLLIIEDLMPAYLSEDWGDWLQTLHRIDHAWLQPCLNALQHKSLQQVRLILTDLHKIAIHEVSLSHPFAFWKKPSLKALQS